MLILGTERSPHLRRFSDVVRGLDPFHRGRQDRVRRVLDPRPGLGTDRAPRPDLGLVHRDHDPRPEAPDVSPRPSHRRVRSRAQRAASPRSPPRVSVVPCVRPADSRAPDPGAREGLGRPNRGPSRPPGSGARSEEHTSELQSRFDLVCRLLLEKKKKIKNRKKKIKNSSNQNKKNKKKIKYNKKINNKHYHTLDSPTHRCLSEHHSLSAHRQLSK